MQTGKPRSRKSAPHEALQQCELRAEAKLACGTRAARRRRPIAATSTDRNLPRARLPRFTKHRAP